MPRLKVSLSIGYVTASRDDVIDIDDDEWNECETEEQKEDLINEYWKDWAWNYIEGDTEILD